ncbi:hypothetical protein KY285_026260 [Solanum tuberosum]|nr:hypothetical protein KY285_026260 [Solanum tuberosum]
MAKGTGASHAWRKMLEIREEVEHDIWWQIKTGEASFWFDNWTKQGALYYIQDHNAEEEEVEVRHFIVNGEWDSHKLRGILSDEMTEYILENISPRVEEGTRETPWWMGIKIEGGLHQMVTRWWNARNNPKLRIIYQAIPAVLMWELWKRRNARKHGKELTFGTPYQQCQNTIFHLMKTVYPWVKVPVNWEGIVECNTDGASSGNPGESTYSFCVRNKEGDLIYAEAQNIGQSTSMEAEIKAIHRAIKFCKNNNFTSVVIETDSLSTSKMIRREWRVPWNHIEEIENIQELAKDMNVSINHVFREANQLADKIANEAYKQQGKMEWHNFHQLPVECKKILNADKSGIPTLRIKKGKSKCRLDIQDQAQTARASRSTELISIAEIKEDKKGGQEIYQPHLCQLGKQENKRAKMKALMIHKIKTRKVGIHIAPGGCEKEEEHKFGNPTWENL